MFRGSSRSGGFSDKFEKFTEHARLVLRLAQEEAQQLNHSFIGTEHLLLGLVREEERDALSTKMLEYLGVQPEAVRAGVIHIIGRGDCIVLGAVGLTARAKKVMELAVDEGRRLNHHYVGTEHLLLGLIREGDGIAAGVLESLGISLGSARNALTETLSPHKGHLDAQPAESEPPAPPIPTAPGPKNNVVTIRLDDTSVGALDALVEAGIRSTRSDAAAWLIGAGIEAHRELFDRVNATVNEIRKLRLEAQDIARQMAGGTDGSGTENAGRESPDTKDDGAGAEGDMKDPEEPEDLDDLSDLDEPPTK
jgi:ATP-dependent Clp protease ATP-binding subunit ClpA